MTTEAAVTKLMWALGQGADLEAFRKIFATNFAGEVTLPQAGELRQSKAFLAIQGIQIVLAAAGARIVGIAADQHFIDLLIH